MEMQFFVKPGEDDQWFEYWRHRAHGMATWRWGSRREKLRFHPARTRLSSAHLPKAALVEYEFPFGWKEFEGIHNRTDFDLTRHQAASGKNWSTWTR